MASWTTTIVIVSTSAVRLTIETATVERISAAAVRAPDQALRDRLVVEGAIEGDRAERDRRRRRARTATGTNQRLDIT